MARVKEPAVVQDDLQNLFGGLAEDLNRLIYGEGRIPWETKFADVAIVSLPGTSELRITKLLYHIPADQAASMARPDENESYNQFRLQFSHR
jgi:hypothetical protein